MDLRVWWVRKDQVDALARQLLQFPAAVTVDESGRPESFLVRADLGFRGFRVLMLGPILCLPGPDLFGGLQDRPLIQFEDGLLLIRVAVSQQRSGRNADPVLAGFMVAP